MATQKYKQQQQQVRVITNESNYLNGMYFSDVPLAEGYSRVVLNFDIDSLSGKLKPRKGLQSLGVIPPHPSAVKYLTNAKGFNTVVNSKVCAASDSYDPRKINRVLQSVVYNTDTRGLQILTSPSETSPDAVFNVVPFTLNNTEEFVTPEPFVVSQPGIHGQTCVHNEFFKKPVGTFAFNNSYYTFLKRNKFTIKKLADLPSADYLNFYGDPISDFTDLKTNSRYATTESTRATGQYFKFVSGNSAGIIAYYDTEGNIAIWERSEEALQLEVFLDPNLEHILCYTKLGKEIQPDEVLLDETLTHSQILPDIYYTCRVVPQELNPSEASSWGYNMLLKNPYRFVCEETAVNNVSILGILPYDKSGKRIILTPHKNQEITLTGFYRAPLEYHSAKELPAFYTTEKIGEVDKVSELPTTKATDYKYGQWWYVKENSEYHMCVPSFESADATDAKPIIALFGQTRPAASEKLSAVNSEAEDKIRVRWQMRSTGASDWNDIYDETFSLKEHYARHGSYAPFTVTTTLPAGELLIRLIITDPVDIVSGEEYVLSTSTVGLSLISDELANTLNLESKVFNLGRCTGMCEWEQRLVLWGVPDALNTLFVSDVNNPTFFPYPNNIDVFNDPIIAVHNYGDELLVLTTSALYRLTWDAEGTGWTHHLVQQNLHVTEADTYMSCVIKNMFFFKSGDYFYMMVPKSSSAGAVRGEVAIAPISKLIANLLDKFHEEVYNLIRVIIDKQSFTDFTNKLVNYFSYVDNTRVVVNYVYALDDTSKDTLVQDTENSKYLYVQLIYDTDTRAWSMRAFESAHMLYPSHTDAIQQDRFVDITPALNGTQYVLQYYKFTDVSDVAIQYINNNGIPEMAEKIIKNYQYLDTGNREINTELKKRFREFQFKIKNNTNTNLGFFTSFLIDGSLRKDFQQYSPRLLLDPTTQEATIVVERTLDVKTMTYNTTRIERVLIPERMLQDNGELTPTTLAEAQDPDRWILNQSAFPGRTLWKIRMPISGKGLTPRAIFLSTNESDYELLGHTWAYRTMNAR